MFSQLDAGIHEGPHPCPIAAERSDDDLSVFVVVDLPSGDKASAAHALNLSVTRSTAPSGRPGPSRTFALGLVIG